MQHLGAFFYLRPAYSVIAKPGGQTQMQVVEATPYYSGQLYRQLIYFVYLDQDNTLIPTASVQLYHSCHDLF